MFMYDGVDNNAAPSPHNKDSAVRAESELRACTEVAALGEVDAFVSYSWRGALLHHPSVCPAVPLCSPHRDSLMCSSSDDSEAQQAQLELWIDEQRPSTPAGRSTRIWIDRCCIDVNNVDISLACLPVFMAGCKKVLVLAGPTFSSRLWCASGPNASVVTTVWTG